MRVEFLEGQVQFEENELTRLFRSAELANPSPTQSKYPVSAAALTDSGIIVHGANHEYGGMNRSIHAEESLVARLLDDHPNDKIKTLLLIAGGPDDKVLPCGNCRDVLQEHLLPDAIVATAPIDLSQVAVLSVKSLYKEDFQRAPSSESIDARALAAATNAMAASCLLYTPASRVYGASLYYHYRGADPRQAIIFPVYAAGNYGDAAFHPGLPIHNAITKLIWNTESDRFDIDNLLIVAKDHLPKVPYLERQHLTEFDARRRALWIQDGGKDPGPMHIFLARLASQFPRIEVAECVETNANEWLPHAFSPANLGIDKAMGEAMQLLCHYC